MTSKDITSAKVKIATQDGCEWGDSPSRTHRKVGLAVIKDHKLFSQASILVQELQAMKGCGEIVFPREEHTYWLSNTK